MKEFLNFVYVRTAEGTTYNEGFLSLFIWVLCLLLGGGDKDNLRGE